MPHLTQNFGKYLLGIDNTLIGEKCVYVHALKKPLQMPAIEYWHALIFHRNPVLYLLQYAIPFKSHNACSELISPVVVKAHCAVVSRDPLVEEPDCVVVGSGCHHIGTQSRRATASNVILEQG